MEYTFLRIFQHQILYATHSTIQIISADIFILLRLLSVYLAVFNEKKNILLSRITYY